MWQVVKDFLEEQADHSIYYFPSLRFPSNSYVELWQEQAETKRQQPELHFGTFQLIVTTACDQHLSISFDT